MSHTASARIQHQRKSIRRVQIHNYFNSRRQILLCLDKQDALQMLMPHFKCLKTFFLCEVNMQEVKLTVGKIKYFLDKYDGLNYLIRTVDFDSAKLAQMVFGPNYREITYLDIILSILKAHGDQLDIVEECTFILSKSAIEFKDKLVKKPCFQNKSQFERQFTRLVQQFPYEFILDDDHRVVVNSLNFVCQIQLAGNNGSTVYFLVNRPNKNIILLVNNLMEKEEMMSKQEVREELMTTAVTMVYFIARYNYIKFEEQQFKYLAQNIKGLILKTLINCDKIQCFSQCCLNLRLIFDSGILNILYIRRNQLQLIQDMIQKQLRNNSILFFCMLKSMMSNTRNTLNNNSIKLILSKIFYFEDETLQAIKLKTLLIKIYYYQIVNKGNRFRSQDGQNFIGHWGQYSKVDRLLHLLNELDQNQQEQGIIKMLNLIQLICIDTQQLNKIIDMTNDEYEEFSNFVVNKMSQHKSSYICQ